MNKATCVEVSAPPEAERSDSTAILIEQFEKCGMLRVIYALGSGPLRFNQLLRAATNNSSTLANRLRDLEAMQLVRRDVLSYMPPHVEYSLTNQGIEVRKVICQVGRTYTSHIALRKYLEKRR